MAWGIMGLGGDAVSNTLLGGFHKMDCGLGVLVGIVRLTAVLVDSEGNP